MMLLVDSIARRRTGALVEAIGRGEGSIEYKHQNISAILKGLGEVWIDGYKPAFNFQWSLADAVARWLARNPAWIVRQPAVLAHQRLRDVDASAQAHGARNEGPLWIGPPPTQSNAPPPDELAQMLAVAAKFDVAERDARNRTLGRAGEARVVASERATLNAAGRGDLARQVRWVSNEDGDGAGYDIASFEPDGAFLVIDEAEAKAVIASLSRDRIALVNALRRWCATLAPAGAVPAALALRIGGSTG